MSAVNATATDEEVENLRMWTAAYLSDGDVKDVDSVEYVEYESEVGVSSDLEHSAISRIGGWYW